MIVHAFRIKRADSHAVTHHRDPVGNLQDFVQPMADKNDAQPALLEFNDIAQQRVDLVPRQRSGRFVHDEKARVGGKRAANRYELPLGN